MAVLIRSIIDEESTFVSPYFLNVWTGVMETRKPRITIESYLVLGLVCVLQFGQHPRASGIVNGDNGVWNWNFPRHV